MSNKNTEPWIVVAVDGQAASGKGTISKRIAGKVCLKYLDTGKLYRALTYYLIRKHRKRLQQKDHPAFFDYLVNHRPNDVDLESDFISRITPSIAEQPWARRLLLQFQREFASTRDDAFKGAILDGRDIGTVVLPDADVKLFIVADIATRAQRRVKQLQDAGEVAVLSKVQENLSLRDIADVKRKASPLVRAEDAILIDTTKTTVDESVQLAIREINLARRRR